MKLPLLPAYGGSVLSRTDQYYARLEGAGPAEGDSVWRAGPGEAAMLNVGRAPVDTPEEARRFVTKTLATLDERRAPTERQVLIAAGYDQLLGDTWTYVADGQLRPLFESDAATHVARLYKNSSAWPGSFAESRATLVDSLDRGYGIAALLGRGGAGAFIAGDDRDRGDWFTSADAYALENSRRLTRFAFMTSFTFTPDSGLSVGEALMDAPEGGAVSVLGPTGLEFAQLVDEFGVDFFRSLVQDGAVTGGEALSRVESTFPTHVGEGMDLVSTSMVLLGDPALPWWGEPVPPSRAAAPEPARPASVQTLDIGGLALGFPSPNPASKATRIVLSVSALEVGSPYEAAIFDLGGRRMRSLELGPAPEGHHALVWDLRDDDGRPVEPGLYFVRVAVAHEIQTRRIVVTR